jgi:DNA-binding NtrC family response regulator
MVKVRRWPGNIRELRNLVEIAVVGARGKVLSLTRALPAIHFDKEFTPEQGPYDIAKREFDRRYYVDLYRRCHGNVTQMARLSGRQRSTVREALRSLALIAAPDDSADDGGREVSEWKRRHEVGRASRGQGS